MMAWQILYSLEAIIYHTICFHHSRWMFMHKGKVRDICGDIGDVEACKHGVKYRSRRKRSRPSQYISSSDHDIAHKKPQNVVPEDSTYMAKSNPQSGSSNYSGQLHPIKSGNAQINILELKENEFTDRKDFCKGARVNWHEKAVEKGKTKYLWTNEVKNLPSEGKKGEPTHVGPVSSNPKYGQSKYSEKSHPTRFGNAQNNTSVQEVKELKSISTPEKEHCQMRQTLSVKDIKSSHAKNQTASASQMSRRSQTCDIPGVKPSKDTKPKDSDAGNVVFTVEEFFLKAAAEEPLPTDPAPDASWMGSFILKDAKISFSFQAHPTSKGLSKVKEFSKQMPQVLEFELCSYKDFSRTFFKGCDPDDKDIGLYFFPNNGIRLNEYISQLEKLSGNIFLRSCIDGVELLVFTSKVLHKDYCKRNRSDFLWGIYRRRHGKRRGAVEETMVANRDISSKDSHIEVDVAGRDLVGPDVVVTEQLIESNIDFPPGFNPSMRGRW